jgi:hypothetical protein
MRSNVALSVVIVIFGAIVTCPQQLVEPITVSEYAREGGALPVPMGDGHGSWIPLIYIVVALILYRLLSAPIEVLLERGGHRRQILLAQVAALVTAVAAGAYYVWSSVTYFHSLRFLERTSTNLARPHVVAQNAAVLGAAVYLTGTVLALMIAAAVVARVGGLPRAARQAERAGRPARAYLGAGVADLAVCTAIGVIQNWEAGLPNALLPVGVGIAGVGLVLTVNRGRRVPVPEPVSRGTAQARQGTRASYGEPRGGMNRS